MAFFCRFKREPFPHQTAKSRERWTVEMFKEREGKNWKLNGHSIFGKRLVSGKGGCSLPERRRKSSLFGKLQKGPSTIYQTVLIFWWFRYTQSAWQCAQFAWSDCPIGVSLERNLLPEPLARTFWALFLKRKFTELQLADISLSLSLSLSPKCTVKEPGACSSSMERPKFAK